MIWLRRLWRPVACWWCQIMHDNAMLAGDEADAKRWMERLEEYAGWND